MTELTVVHTRSEAELLLATLRARGLRAMASADDGGGWGPNVGIEGVRVLVLEADFEEARQALKEQWPGGAAPGAGSGRTRPRPRKRRPAR